MSEMTVRERTCRLVAVLGVILGSDLIAPDVGLAQTRPFRGLFQTEAGPESGQSLTFSASLYGGYDDNATAQQQGPTDPRAQAGSSFAGADFGLQYGKQMGPRVDFGAGVSTGLRYYPDLRGLGGGAYRGNAGLAVELDSRTQLHLGQGVGYAPFYQLNPFPGLDVPGTGGVVSPDLNLTLIKRPSWRYDTNVSLSRQLGRRSTLSAFYSRSQTDFDDVPTVQPIEPIDPPPDPNEPLPPPPVLRGLDFTTQSAGFQFLRRLTRYASLRLGYAYRTGRYESGDEPTVDSHDLNIGVDYDRALSISRRAVLSFSTGSSILQTEDRTQARVNGRATLAVAISRAWDSSISYNRGLSYVDGLSAPVFSDSVAARLRGTLTSRLTTSFGAAYSTGESAVVAERDRYGTYTGNAQAQYAISRFLAAYVEYFYYHYDFDDSAALSPLGAQSRFSRNGYRGGLQFWLPILR